MSERTSKSHHLLESIDGGALQPLASGNDIEAGLYLWSRGFYWREVRGFKEQRISDQEYRYFDSRGDCRAVLVIENQNAPAPARAGAHPPHRKVQRSISSRL